MLFEFREVIQKDSEVKLACCQVLNLDPLPN